MIHDHDRSGWIGASDTDKVMGPWRSKSFGRWWGVKLGLWRDDFTTLAMRTGTAYEHPILEYLGVPIWDRQIKVRRLRLRVNLDGEHPNLIHEVKTYGGPAFKATRPYWMQAQVEMFAAKKPLEIVAYRLEAEDYHNWFREIDPDRLSHHPVDYDQTWVDGEYLPRLKYLAGCLRKGAWPDEDAYRRGKRHGDGL